MSKKEQHIKVPQLRFPEFLNGGEWIEKKLGDCLLLHPEYGINAAAVPFSENLPTYLRITDISEDGRYLSEQKVSVAKEVTDEDYLEQGDIVFARTGASVGKSYKYREEDGRLVFAGFLIRVRPDKSKLLSELLYQFLSSDSYWKWVAFTSQRSGQPGINGNEFASLLIPVPVSKAEQQKIADCLSSLDDLIAAEREKLDALKAHKKGLMQELFPAGGETVPKLRFPEFWESGEWDGKTLGTICKMQSGKFVSASEIHETIGEDLFPCYGGNGLRGYTRSFNQNGQYSLIGRQGALCGNVTLVDGRFYATEHAVVVSPNNNVDTIWLYYQLTRLNLNQYATGQAQPGVSVENLEKVVAQIPSSEFEQRKIATCLSSSDDLITACIETIEQLKAHKKGLMQQLFPSE